MIPANRLALDVSNNNPINALELKTAKPEILFCKATEGVGFEDKTYTTHRALAHNAGIRFGAYYFLHPKSEGNEAEFFLNYAKPTKDTVLACDVEITDGASMQEVAARAYASLKYLAGNSPSMPLLYCSSSWWKTLTAFEPRLKNYPVWEAQYPGAFTKWVPGIANLRVRLRNGATVLLWQWTNHFRVGNRYFDASRIMGNI